MHEALCGKGQLTAKRPFIAVAFHKEGSIVDVSAIVVKRLVNQ